MDFLTPNTALYLAIALYAGGTVLVLGALFQKHEGAMKAAIAFASVAFLSHTIFIGTICTRTHHPPLTNLPEAATFIAWLIMAGELLLLLRYKVQAASYFVFPFVVLLLVIAAVISEPFAPIDPERSSRLFITHLLLTTTGIALLMIALAFGVLYKIQDYALRTKKRGTFYEKIPSVRVCDLVSFRALVAGFGIYTAGILAGILWSYRIHHSVTNAGPKEIGAIVAWFLFAAILQSHLSGTFRTRRTAVIAVAAFVSILVSILGIAHV